MIKISINPIAFLNIRWYGIMIALGIVAIILWMVWQVRKGAKISYDTVLTAAIVGIPSGVVVSRLLHVVDNIVVAKLHPELARAGSVVDYTQYPSLIIGGAGLTIYGAVLGAALGIWVYSKFTKLQFSYFADLVTPGIILAQMIGRVGCTINGCCYGIEASAASLGTIVYSPKYPPNIGGYLIDANLLGKPVYATTIYEIIFLGILLGGILLLRGRLKPDGSLFLVYLSLYSLWRVGIDFLRVGTPFLFGLHQAQVIGLVTLTITALFLANKVRWVKAEDKVGAALLN